MDTPIDSVDCDSMEDDSAPQIQHGYLYQPDRWVLPYVFPEYPDELEYPAAIQYTNTALAGDPDVGDRLPLSENAPKMVDDFMDGWILAKLTNFILPGAIDVHALNKPKNNGALSMFQMIENNTVISKVYQTRQDLPVDFLIRNVINADREWIFRLIWAIIWHALKKKASEIIRNCDAINLYQRLGQNMTSRQFFSSGPIEVAYEWLQYHLNTGKWDGRAFDVNDNRDGKNYIVLLHQLDPDLCSLAPLATEDPVLRAEQLLNQAERLHCRKFLTPPSLSAGCINCHLAFVINIFNTYAGREFIREGIPEAGENLYHSPDMIKGAYEPLNLEVREVRLLNILPSTDRNEDIRGYLTHHDLDADINNISGGAMCFDALSYVWGDVEPMGNAYITDQEIQVRPNLVAALKHLRSSENVCQLWVDALCIDQGNTEERNHQVGLMNAIYSKSRRVISWLGEQSETSHLAMTYLNRVNEIFQFQNPPKEATLSRWARNLESEGYWTALYHLFHHPYWTRLWIVQEVLLNESPHSVIRYGDDSVRWLTLELGLKTFQEWSPVLPEPGKEALRAADHIIELCELRLARRAANKRAMAFLDALVLGRRRKATNSADHVYGILALLDHKGLPALPAHEESTMNVFRKAMQHIVQTDGSLDILSACQLYDIGNQQCCRDKVLIGDLRRTNNSFKIVDTSYTSEDRLRERSTNKWDFFRTLGSAQPNPQAEQSVVEFSFEEDAGRVKIPDSLFGRNFGPFEELLAQMKRYQTPWPSWLPDWTLPLFKEHSSSITSLLLSDLKPQFYSAGGHQKPKIDFDRIMPSVGISGFQFCSIAHLGPDDHESENIWQQEHMLWEWYKGLDNVRNPYENETGKRTAFVLLEILGKDLDGNESTYQSSFASKTSLLPNRIETGIMSDSHGSQLSDDVPPRRRAAVENNLDHDLREWELWVSKPQTTRPEIENEQSMLGETGEDESEVRRTPNPYYDLPTTIYANVEHIVSHVSWMSRYFVTEQGYIGRGPLSIEKGDSVGIFFGGKTPYILCDAGNEGYYLRGECYIQGIMKGEAMTHLHPLKEFVLR